MANLVRTAKGKLIDMNQLYLDNQKSIALGNASRNARGDIVKHGKVVKTVEELRAEYDEANSRSTSATVPLSNGKKIEEIASKEVEELKPVVARQKVVKSKKEKPAEQPMNDFLSLSDIVNNTTVDEAVVPQSSDE